MNGCTIYFSNGFSVPPAILFSSRCSQVFEFNVRTYTDAYTLQDSRQDGAITYTVLAVSNCVEHDGTSYAVLKCVEVELWCGTCTCDTETQRWVHWVNVNVVNEFCLHVKVSPRHSLFVASPNVATSWPGQGFFACLLMVPEGLGNESHWKMSAFESEFFHENFRRFLGTFHKLRAVTSSVMWSTMNWIFFFKIEKETTTLPGLDIELIHLHRPIFGFSRSGYIPYVFVDVRNRQTHRISSLLALWARQCSHEMDKNLASFFDCSRSSNAGVEVSREEVNQTSLDLEPLDTKADFFWWRSIDSFSNWGWRRPWGWGQERRPRWFYICMRHSTSIFVREQAYIVNALKYHDVLQSSSSKSVPQGTDLKVPIWNCGSVHIKMCCSLSNGIPC